MSQNALNSYKYENEINFNVNDVKNAIKFVLSTNNTRFIHEDKDLNDTFGTYKFGEIKCGYLVSVSKVDENNTKITITCSERYGFSVSMASLEAYTAELLNIISAKLEGKTDEEVKVVAQANNSDSSLASSTGCLNVILYVIGFLITMFIIFKC